MSIVDLIRDFLKSERGNFAVITGLVALPLLGASLLALDYSRATSLRSSLQDAADATALSIVGASSRGLKHLDPAEEDRLKRQGRMFFAANAGVEAVPEITIDKAAGEVSVSAEYELDGMFPELFSKENWTVGVFSKAGSAGPRSTYCLVALTQANEPGISLGGTADFLAPDCTVYSNSPSAGSITQSGSSTFRAKQACAVGKTKGKFSPPATEGCEPIDDPFASLAFPPKHGVCNYRDAQFSGGSHVLFPGRYCGGIRLLGAGNVKMSPGEYILIDGPLEISKHTVLEGDDVTIIMMGADSHIDFTSGSTVSLAAPKTGPFAGIAIAQNKANSSYGISNIQGGGSIEVTGAVYLPTQTIHVTGGGDIGITADQSAIVADKFVLQGNGAISLKINFNSDYDAAGYRPGALGAGATPRLIQ